MPPQTSTKTSKMPKTAPTRVNARKEQVRIVATIGSRGAQKYKIEELEKILQTYGKPYDLKAGGRAPKQYLLRQVSKLIHSLGEDDLDEDDVEEILTAPMDSTPRRYQMMDDDGKFMPTAYPLGKVPMGQEEMERMLRRFEARITASFRPDPQVEGVLKICAGCHKEHGEIQYPEKISDSCTHDDVPYCRTCVAKYLRQKIADGDSVAVDCPACHQTLGRESVKKLVPPAVFERYRKLD